MKTLCLLLVCCFAAAPSFAAPALTDPNLTAVEVVSGLDFPTTLAFIGDNDILVLQKNDGKVLRILDGVLQPDPVLDVAVDSTDEHGLLSIALHPDFTDNPFVYLFYTESATSEDDGGAAANRIVKYTWNGSALVAPLSILDFPVNSNDHIGGIILFGPDGKLYVILGDQNHDGQLQNSPTGAPDDTSVILRLNDDGSPAPGNPFASQGSPLDKYYAYGIRNSFGMAFDPMNGNLWDTENGVNDYDEVNLVLPGFNSGWNSIQGPDGRSPQNAGTDLFVVPGSRYADPKFSWKATVGPTGIAFLDSTALGAQYENDVFVGDIKNSTLYHFEPNAARDGFVLNGNLADLVADKTADVAPIVFGTGFQGITDVKTSPDGHLYVVSYVGGRIYRIQRNVSFGAAPLPPAEVGAPYVADLQIGGGTPPYTIAPAPIAGALPNGLTIAGAGLAGTPTVAKKFTFTLRVTDAGNASATRQFSLQVLKALAISTKSLKNGKAGKGYKATLKATGGRAPYTWALLSGPPWAQISESGQLTGVPTAGMSDITFQVTDDLGVTKEVTLSLTITN